MSPTTSLEQVLTVSSPGGPGWAADVVAETTPSPSPSDDPLRPELDPTDVTPGLPGFLAIFAVAVAAIGLFFALSRQLRRMNRNAERQGIGPDGPLDETPDAADGRSEGDAGGDRPGQGDRSA